MRSAPAALILLTLAVPAPAAVPDTTWPPSEREALQYADSTGLWRVLAADLPQTKILDAVRTLRENPFGRQFPVWPGYEVMLDEGGDWYLFAVGMRAGYSLLLSAESTVTLIDEHGDAVKGCMRFLRPRDTQSRDVFDVAQRPLLVYPGPFMGGVSGPTIAVRFPEGSVKWKNVRAVTAGGVRAVRTEGR